MKRNNSKRWFLGKLLKALSELFMMFWLSLEYFSYLVYTLFGGQVGGNGFGIEGFVLVGSGGYAAIMSFTGGKIPGVFSILTVERQCSIRRRIDFT